MLGFLAVVIYVAGLFCINFYLSQYGLSDYSLLRVRYLLAGTWLAVAFVASGLPPALGWWWGVADPLTRGSWMQRKASLAGCWAAPVVIWLVCFYWLGMFEGNGRDFDPNRVLACVGDFVIFEFFSIVVCVIVAGAVFLLTAASDEKLKEHGIDPRKLDDNEHTSAPALALAALFALIPLALFAALSLRVFSTDVYPRIPEEYGGGMPIRARLLLGGSAKSIKSIGLPLPPGSLVSFPVDIIHLTDQMALVRTGLGNIVDVDRKLVSGIQVRPPEAWIESPYLPPWDFRELNDWETTISGQIANLPRRKCFEAEMSEVILRAKVPGAKLGATGKLEFTALGSKAICGYSCESSVEGLSKLQTCIGNNISPCIFKDLPECQP